jgi:hypothetical protein
MRGLDWTRTMERLLTTIEAAQLLNLKPNTLEIWRIRGVKDLPYRIVGTRSVRYAEHDVIAFANRDVRTSTSQKPCRLTVA